MKRFIDIHIPVTHCNLQCHYCYVPQNNLRNTPETPFNYDISTIKKALTVNRLGGVCHFNLCGLGETLIPHETFEVTKALLENGHYVMIVTNGLLTNRIKEFDTLPEELKKRVGFKCSFHYLELKKKKLLNHFFDNIDYIRKSGMSFSLELTPSDELEPYIEAIKDICQKRVGALCHVTIPRDMTKEGIILLSRHTFNEFYNIWRTFDSEMFEFKSRLWEDKRHEFCHAGEWSGLLNIGNGIMSQCYGNSVSQNIFENIDRPIEFFPIGHNCSMPHCYNAHSLLGLGNIPEILGNYALERDRIDCRDGSHWLTEEMRFFLAHRLEHYNELPNQSEEKVLDQYWKKRYLKFAFINYTKKMIHKIRKII